MSVFSEKQASDVPDALFDAAAHKGVTTVNLSKNQLTSIPNRYTHTQTEKFVMAWLLNITNTVLCVMFAGWLNSNHQCQILTWALTN